MRTTLHELPIAVADRLYAATRPLLFTLDAERAHHLVTGATALVARLPFGLRLLRALGGSDEGLAVEAFGRRFANPLGIAGGLDKEGHLIDALGALGFGHVEVGTVTPRPQPGNPRPRIFRLPKDQALINRMGFPSSGVEPLARRLAAARRTPVVVGVSIGKNKETPPEQAAADYARCLAAIGSRADFFTINVSSPNTPGLRDLALGTKLGELLAAIREAQPPTAATPPLLLKLSPDLAREDLETAVDQALAHGIAGLVVANTTLGRDGLASVNRMETGGLSGRPLFTHTVELVRRVYAQAGQRVPIVGVGGVFTADDAYALIRAGATLVQLYTSFVYRGPTHAVHLKAALRHLLARDGLTTPTEAIAADR